MVRHIVSWNYREEVPAEKREALNGYFREAFPALVGLIPGVTKVDFFAPPLSSSSKDLCLYVEMEGPEVIEVYANHPEHIKVAQHIRANCKDRCCTDIEA